MPGQESKARQVSTLGESPAEARRRMQSSGGGAAVSAEVTPPLSAETAATGTPGPRHIAAMREQEGFGGGPAEDATVEEASDTAAPPSPEKAMDMIRQLSQDNLQKQTELDAALAKLQRYEAQFGEID